MRVFRIDVGTGAYQEVRPEGAGAEGALVWVDLDLTDITTPERFKELGSIGLPEAPPLYFELVARWHAPDEPAFTSEDFLHWDADEAATVNTPGGPRMITAPYVDVNVPIGIEGRPELGTHFVTLLAGPGWLITSRMVPAIPLDELRDEALSDWRSDYRAGGDLGMLILRALAESYLPTLQRLRARLQIVEQAFVEGQEDRERVTALDSTGFRLQLLDLKWAVDSLSVTLPPLLRPGEQAQVAWLHVPSAVEAANSFAARLDAATKELSALREAISGAFAFAASAEGALQLERATETLELTRQIQESEQERARAADASERRTRDLQDAVTLVAAVLLGPGLVAAVYGAMPSIFDGCQIIRGATMAGFMILAGLGAWFVLSQYRRGEPDRRQTG